MLRLGDCCVLPWSHVDLNNDLIRTRVRKTSAFVQIPIFGLLKEVLMEAQKTKLVRCKLVFPESERMHHRDSSFFSRLFDTVLLSVGFTDDDNPETSIRLPQSSGKGRRVSVRGMHALKTTWITNALTNGVSISLIKKIVGNRSVDVILEHYFQPEVEASRGIIKQALPAVLSGEERTVTTEAERKQEFARLVQELDASNWKETQTKLKALLKMGK